MGKRKNAPGIWRDRQRTEALSDKLQPNKPKQDKFDNLVICVSGIGTMNGFSCIISDRITDLGIAGATQCFPLHYYVQNDKPKKTTTPNHKE